MSSFTCINDHEFRGPRCPICGGKVHYMDGLTGKQWAQIEADNDILIEDDSDYEAQDDDQFVFNQLIYGGIFVFYNYGAL